MQLSIPFSLSFFRSPAARNILFEQKKTDIEKEIYSVNRYRDKLSLNRRKRRQRQKATQLNRHRQVLSDQETARQRTESPFPNSFCLWRQRQRKILYEQEETQTGQGNGDRRGQIFGLKRSRGRQILSVDETETERKKEADAVRRGGSERDRKLIR